MRRAPQSSAPQWLRRWRLLLQHVMEYVYNVSQMVLTYSAVSMKPLLKDMALKVFFPKQMATTVLSSMAAMQSQSNQLGYVNRPEDCEHPSGLRSYGAGGYRMKICDLCESRWAHLGQGGELQKCQPKATPTAKTPLGVLTPKSKSQESGFLRKFGLFTTAISAFLATGILDEGTNLQGSTSPQGQVKVGSAGNLREAGYRDDPRGAAQLAPSLGGHDDEEPSSSGLRLREWRGGPRHSPPLPGGLGERARGLGDAQPNTQPTRRGLVESRSRTPVQLSQRCISNPSTTRLGVGTDLGPFSVENPMMPSDLGSFRLRDGVRKRLAGNCKQLSQLLVTEAQVYQDRTQRSRILRRHSFDLVEIYAGMANISAEALSQGLRVLQPVDLVHGLKLETRKDHEMLREILKDRKPFLVVWEIRCDPWSNIQHLNYTEDQLETIRSSQKLAIEEMCKTIKEMRPLGCRFLLENPWGTPFWQQEDIQQLLQLEHVQLVCGSMCNFGLRGRNGLLMQKKTGWCSDVDAILKNVWHTMQSTA